MLTNRFFTTSVQCSLFFTRVLIFSFLLIPAFSQAQLDVEFETTLNTNCDGSECDYDGPGILINELMVSPISFDGSLWGGLATQAGEWIELYNPDFCDPVDISCYYLGNAASDGLLRPGGYVIPEGTVVPPAGFVIIRGINAQPVPANLLIENGGNTIELVVESNANATGQVCVGGGTRLWFPNAGGWFAFYDSFGEPQDAVRWATPPPNDLASQPCVPPFPSCQSANSLVSYNDFPEDRKENIYSGGSAADFQGQSFRRIPDGGSWSGASAATYGTCNAECVDPGTSTCNGTANAIPEGGLPPYTYQWNDAQSQNTQTAVGLCGGEYCVIITDAEDVVTEQCVIIEEPDYETDQSGSFCSNENYLLPDNTVVTEPGTYDIMLQTAGGCDSLVVVDLEVLPSYDFDLSAEICLNQSYELPDGTEVSESGTYELEYQTSKGCDSLYTVVVSVEPLINIPLDVSICEGETYTLPDGTVVSEADTYEVLMPGEADCDTLYNIVVGINPTFVTNREVSICFGESHILPNGEEVNESGFYVSEFQTELGCDSVIETLVMVNPLPVLSIPLEESYCFNSGIVAINPQPPGGVLSGFFVSDDELNLNFAPAGDYFVSYTYTDDDGCTNSVQHDYTVLPEVRADFTYSANCFNVAEFTNLSNDTLGNYTYLWTIEDEPFSTEVSPSYPYEETGDFTVTLTATNSADCSDMVSYEVTFLEGLQLSEYWLPNIITPNGDGLNERFMLMPLDDDCLTYNITVFNRWGIQVYDTNESGAPFAGRNVNGAELEDGVYFYIFESPQIDCNNVMFENLCKGSVTIAR